MNVAALWRALATGQRPGPARWASPGSCTLALYRMLDGKSIRAGSVCSPNSSAPRWSWHGAVASVRDRDRIRQIDTVRRPEPAGSVSSPPRIDCDQTQLAYRPQQAAGYFITHLGERQGSAGLRIGHGWSPPATQARCVCTALCSFGVLVHAARWPATSVTPSGR